MRRWLEGSKVVAILSWWSMSCVPAPAEVETVTTSTSTAGGSSSTTAVPELTTTTPGDTTANASGSGGSSGGSSSGASDSSSSSSDGGSSDSTGEPTDEPLGPFDAPVAVGELNDAFAAEDDPTLTADMLEIYFGSTRSGSEDVWMSTRADVGDPWDTPVRVDSLSSGATDTLVEVSGDGLFVLVASDRAAAFDQDVYYSQRADREQPWPAPQPLTGAANPGTSDFGVTPSPDLMSAFLCRIPSGQSDIYEASADFVGWVISEPTLVMELSSPGEDCSVSLSQSRREIFLETTRSAATFGWNLFVATRENPAYPWQAPVEVAELNSNADDQDPWLSPDRRTLYFASSRSGNSELYVATRR